MISYRRAKLVESRAIVESFLQAQWAETGDAGLECKPNWKVYGALEAAKALLLLLPCDGERPIGYLAAFIHPHMNSVDNRVASISTYFVEQRPARALILFRLFEEAIARLSSSRNEGGQNMDTNGQNPVRQINLEAHAAFPGIGRLATKLGFHPAKIGYKLTLGQE